MQPFESTNHLCTLCSGKTNRWTTDKPTRAITAGRVRARSYYRCERCGLVHVAASDRLSTIAERERYLAHRNETPEYREHLARFVEHAVVPCVPTGAHLLDYGSGPVPVLAGALKERGYGVTCWDPHFAADRAALTRRYDAIVLHEVIEHIADATGAFEQLVGLLERDGRLIVRTRPYPDSPEEFAGWWYRADPTHVSFYSAATFRWVAEHYGCTMNAATDDSVVLGAASNGT